ncbi:MAG: hypothetical protein ACK5LR_05410, partial [Mangrovibacterium sp.]
IQNVLSQFWFCVFQIQNMLSQNWFCVFQIQNVLWENTNASNVFSKCAYSKAISERLCFSRSFVF